MKKEVSMLGNIYISHRAIATVVYQAVVETYGIVGLAPKNIVKGVAHAIVNDPTMGVDVVYDGDTVEINIYVIVEYGTRIKTVANSVANVARYKVENIFCLPVNRVNVHVRGLRISNSD